VLMERGVRQRRDESGEGMIREPIPNT
jgi:hypothetical protein